MRYVSVFLGFLFAGCLNGLAVGSEPPVARLDPPTAIVDVPAADCDCNPCVCPPGDCHCLNCKTHSRPVVTSRIAQLIAAASIGQCGGPAPAGFHWATIGNRCTLQPNGATFTYLPTPSPATYVAPEAPVALTAGSICPCCGMVMTATQAAKATATMGAAMVTSAPLTYSAPMTTTYTTTSFGDAVSVGDAEAGGGRQGFFARWRARRAARKAGGGGCGG